MNDQSFIYSWHANTDRLHVYHRWTLYSRERMFSIEIHKDTWNDVEPKGTMIRKKNNCLRKRRRSDCLWQSSDSERWRFFLWFFFFKKRVAILQERSCTLLFPRSSSFVMPCVAWDLKRKGRRYMAFQTLDVFEEEEKTNRATWWCWWLGYYFFYCISFFFFLFSLC